MADNPFGGDFPRSKRVNPFGPDEGGRTPEEAASRMEHAARKIRALRSQVGAEGMTIPATRELIDEVAAALEAGADALRGLAHKK